MKKIAIVTDSTVSFTPQQIEELNAIIFPLQIIDGDVVYLDQVTLDNTKVKDLLRSEHILKTSQPSLGDLVEGFTKIKEDNYDYIFAIAVSGKLSGTYNAMYQAVEEVGLDNISLIDSKSVAGPIQKVLHYIKNEITDREDYEEIAKEAQNKLWDSISYVYPSSLDTLKRGGRISSGAATLASLFKIKPLLYFDSSCESIEKLGTARTESKLYSMLMEDVAKRGITPQTHDLVLLQCEGEDMIERFEPFVKEYDKTYCELPAVLAAHAGLSTVAIQFVEKS